MQLVVKMKITLHAQVSNDVKQTSKEIKIGLPRTPEGRSIPGTSAANENGLPQAKSIHPEIVSHIPPCSVPLVETPGHVVNTAGEAEGLKTRRNSTGRNLFEDMSPEVLRMKGSSVETKGQCEEEVIEVITLDSQVLV